MKFEDCAKIDSSFSHQKPTKAKTISSTCLKPIPPKQLHFQNPKLGSKPETRVSDTRPTHHL